MFEDKSELLQGHISFFEEVLSEEVGDPLDVAAIVKRIEDSKRDIEQVRSELPYDECNMEDEPIENFSGDILDDDELEDEVIDIEDLIGDLMDLIDEVEERLEEVDDDEDDSDNLTTDIEKTCDCKDFSSLLEEWLIEEITAKCNRKGIEISEADAIKKAKALILGARCIGKFEEAEAMAQEECPEYGFTAETLKQEDMFSPGLYHITMEMINTHNLLGERFDFKQWLKGKREFWENMI